jgi:hypothetical protein
MVMMTGSVSVRGTLVWLTPQQGGRVAGPPAPDYDYDYTATAYLPPRTAKDGQAGIALRGFAPGAWRSMAEGFLVADENTPMQHVWPGSVVVVTEGERPWRTSASKRSSPSSNPPRPTPSTPFTRSTQPWAPSPSLQRPFARRW